MAIQSSCPHCQESYRLPDNQLGKRVRCKGCGETFLVQEEEEVPVLEEASAEDVRRAVRPARRDEELDEYEDDDRVATSRARPAPPPPPSRRDDEDGEDLDDEEEEPRGGGGTVLVIVGAVLAILLLLGVGGGLAAYFALSGGKPDDQQAGINPPPDLDKGKIGIPFVPPDRDRNKQPPIQTPPIQTPPVQPVEDNSPPKDVPSALTMLQNFRVEKKRLGLDYLLTAPVTAGQREEVERALEPLQTDRQLSETVEKVLARWSPDGEIKRLEKRLKDHDRHTYGKAMERLAALTDDRAAELLAGQLEVVFREEEAAKHLTKMGKRAEKAVLPYYNDTRSGTQEWARKILSAIGTGNDAKAKQCLADLNTVEEKADTFNDFQRNSKRQTILGALKTLKPLGDKEVNDKISKHLEALITDKDYFTAEKAFEAIAEWGQPDCIPALVEVANKDLGKKDKAIKALMKFKDDERILPVMLALLGDRQHRIEAAKSLVAMAEKAEKVLLLRQKEIMASDKDTRQAVYAILAEVGGRESAKMLTALAKLEAGRGGDKQNATIATAAAAKINERLKLAPKDK